MSDYGAQYARDDDLTARMRFHQSWWRVHRLHQSECGVDARGRRYGNYLSSEAANDGWNFLTDEIFDVATRRIHAEGGVEAFRCLHNLLSSQPMAFNLFGPLRGQPELGRELLDPLLPGGVRAVSEVRIEWAPKPRSDYLGDATSFDVVVNYTTNNGTTAIAGIETKLTEPFSQLAYDTPRYRAVASACTTWHDPADLALANIRWNQMWRNHLLAASIVQDSGPVRRACEIVVHHPDDDRCIDAVVGYREHLAAKESCFAVDLRTIVDTWRPLLARQGLEQWIDGFADRYLNLELSDQAWAEHQPKRSAVTKGAGMPVTQGHRRSLELLQRTTDVRETIARYEDSAAAASVYLRPTNAGLVVLSLDWKNCKSMISVGAKKANEHVLVDLPPDESSVALAATGYLAKRENLARHSEEERFALRCIEHAVTNALRLPGPAGFCFIHQEWRLPRLGTGAKIDLLAVDPASRRLMVIECKESVHLETTAADQAHAYADEIWSHRSELYPFFTQLARAMAAIHGASDLLDLELDTETRPGTLVWWPGNPIN